VSFFPIFRPINSTVSCLISFVAVINLNKRRRNERARLFLDEQQRRSVNRSIRRAFLFSLHPRNTVNQRRNEIILVRLNYNVHDRAAYVLKRYNYDVFVYSYHRQQRSDLGQSEQQSFSFRVSTKKLQIYVEQRRIFFPTQSNFIADREL